VQSKGADGKVTSLHMTLDDEKQLLSEKPALRQIYEAQVRTALFRAAVFSAHAIMTPSLFGLAALAVSYGVAN
jgi:hypothetical protein